MTRLLRLHHWWASKIPPTLAVAYLAVARHAEQMAMSVLAGYVALFLVSCLGIGGLGYLLTDAHDVAEDRRLGKANGWAALTPVSRFALMLALLVAAWLPWWWLPNANRAMPLVALELLLFLVYAVPPIRFKERGLAGLATDALYAHVLPVLVAWVTFSPAPLAADVVTPVLFAGWMFGCGMRHLARHQHDDLDRDRLAGLRTFAVARGREGTMRFIVLRVLPAEVIVAGAAVLWLAPWAPALLAGAVLHVAWELHVTRRRFLAPRPALRTMSLVERHDLVGQRLLSTFVERWLAPLALVTVVLHDARALWLVPLHLLLLGAPLRAWWREVRALPRIAVAAP